DAVDEGARPHETDPLPIASRGDIDFSGVTRRSPTDLRAIVAPPHPPAARVPPSPPLRGGEGRGEVGALPPSRAASELELLDDHRLVARGGRPFLHWGPRPDRVGVELRLLVERDAIRAEAAHHR